MGQCPVCNTTVNASFGMIQCSQCQTMLFVDFSGNVIVGGDEAMGGDTPEIIDVPIIEVPSVSPEGLSFESSESSEALEAITPSDFGSSSELSTEIPADLNDSTSFSPAASFAEIEDQGGFRDHDSSEVQQRESSNGRALENILYRVIIEEIDTAQLRKSVLDSLRDSRLGLVNGEATPDIINGVLKIQGLNPVKASYIINSLKELPLPVKWEVYGDEDSKENS